MTLTIIRNPQNTGEYFSLRYQWSDSLTLSVPQNPLNVEDFCTPTCLTPLQPDPGNLQLQTQHPKASEKCTLRNPCGSPLQNP